MNVQIRGKRKIQRVQVIAAPPVSRTITATGPCGLRFELTLDDAAALLEDPDLIGVAHGVSVFAYAEACDMRALPVARLM